jgi:hypothetical protein
LGITLARFHHQMQKIHMLLKMKIFLKKGPFLMGIQDFRNSNKALVYFSFTMSVMPLQACLLRKMLTFKYFNLDDVAMMSKLT